MNTLVSDFDRLGAESRKFLAEEHGLRIGGKATRPATGARTPLIDPSSGETVGYAAEAGLEDVDAAVAAARHALEQGPWARMRPYERAAAMSKLADLI